ncbi:ubiquitin carboxyl-terminal hydrolase MINDY-1 isoform X2 [Ricinus communis]|uniref:ubiquitin carboxyl-terminal hydrolase MINDY-1 isoform X2 n=1 Tax=Ricinus communis TaxID=3988 RepID=UPI00201A7F13|nr:ubiquitin carboxyl-terminal hydrolase MINDY-1 isoform X2 [Ricinus communis]
MEMASASSSSPTTTEEQNQQQQQLQQAAAVKEKEKEKEKECVHKTKTIQFLGRTAPIVLQNDNGPCPLLAICNILLLRNNLNLSPDIAEVSQEKLLSLVAEHLIDSNSNNKDAGYVENQQQNIADAIDLLPRLATGIDVNIKFRRIDDFEFTPECAIFDLLDIPLYHGWIVDPQDYDTAIAIGSKSYNAIMGELVALETQVMEGESKNNAEEDSVDFVAATTATLGVPSPCLSKTRSFDDSPHSVSDNQSLRKGDLEEEAELLMALKLSEAELPTSTGNMLVADVSEGVLSAASDKHTSSKESVPVSSVDMLKGHVGTAHGDTALSNDHNNLKSVETLLGDMTCSPSMTDLSKPMETLPGEITGSPSKTTDQSNLPDLSTYKESREHNASTDIAKNCNIKMSVQIEDTLTQSENFVLANEDGIVFSRGGEMVKSPLESIANVHEAADISSGRDPAEASGLSMPNPDSDSSSGRLQNVDVTETFTSSVDGSEPIYEGEECILDSGTATFEDREPMYEGEVILAEQADKSVRLKDEITPQQGELIKNFLKNNASQLTFYGLFCLQDGLKERELCVFFRNNHFSTMFKYDGELYLLATDQGYLNQPDLVWEKLNEVNGDTLFMTGNFKEFKVENQGNDTWNEHNAMASTADYIASFDNAAQAGLDINSDLQLAIALQQQEFEQQQPQRSNVQQPVSGNSRLVTGPQVQRSSGKYSSSSRPEAKSKDKCIVM